MTLNPVPIDREPAAGAVLLTGIPGSGKSTVAEALAGRPGCRPISRWTHSSR